MAVSLPLDVLRGFSVRLRISPADGRLGFDMQPRSTHGKTSSPFDVGSGVTLNFTPFEDFEGRGLVVEACGARDSHSTAECHTGFDAIMAPPHPASDHRLCSSTPSTNYVALEAEIPGERSLTTDSYMHNLNEDMAADAGVRPALATPPATPETILPSLSRDSGNIPSFGNLSSCDDLLATFFNTPAYSEPMMIAREQDTACLDCDFVSANLYLHTLLASNPPSPLIPTSSTASLLVHSSPVGLSDSGCIDPRPFRDAAVASLEARWHESQRRCHNHTPTLEDTMLSGEQPDYWRTRPRDACSTALAQTDRESGGRSTADSPVMPRAPTPARTPVSSYDDDSPPSTITFSFATATENGLEMDPLPEGANRRLRRIPCSYPECSRRFTTDYTRRVHERTHKVEPRMPVVCTMGCSETFSRQHDRLRHEVAKHGKVCEYNCEKCERFFSSERQLNIHNGKCGGEKATVMGPKRSM